MSLLGHCGLQDNGVQDLADGEVSTGVSTCPGSVSSVDTPNVEHDRVSDPSFCPLLSDDHHRGRLRRRRRHRGRFPHDHRVRTTVFLGFLGENFGLCFNVLSRSSHFSAYIANRVTDKLTKVCDNIYCCRSGSAADTQAITDIVSYYMDLSR